MAPPEDGAALYYATWETSSCPSGVLDAASAACTQILAAQRSGKPLAPTVLSHYEQQFQSLTEHREGMRTIIGQWWTLVEDERHRSRLPCLSGSYSAGRLRLMKC